MDNKETQRCEFYRFWAWEYTRRNTRFVEFVELDDTPDSLVFSEFGYFNEDAKILGFYSPDEIIRSLVSKSDLIRPHFARWHPRGKERGIYPITGSPLSGEIKHELSDFARAVGLEKRGVVLASIDLTRSINVLVADIKALHAHINAGGIPEMWSFSQEFEIACINDNPIISFDVDDRPRAVGLWLWNYVQDKVGIHPPGGRWLAKAIAALKDKFHVSVLGYADSEKETFRKLYRRTSACIEAAEVLTLK